MHLGLPFQGTAVQGANMIVVHVLQNEAVGMAISVDSQY